MTTPMTDAELQAIRAFLEMNPGDKMIHMYKTDVAVLLDEVKRLRQVLQDAYVMTHDPRIERILERVLGYSDDATPDAPPAEGVQP